MRIPIKSSTFYMLQMSCIHIIFFICFMLHLCVKLYMAHLFVVVVIVILFSKHFNLHKPEYKRRDSSIYQTFNRVERAVGSELDPWKLNDNVVTIETSLMTKMKCARDELTCRHFNCKEPEKKRIYFFFQTLYKCEQKGSVFFRHLFRFPFFVLHICAFTRISSMIVYPYFRYEWWFSNQRKLYANTNDWKDLLGKLDDE